MPYPIENYFRRPRELISAYLGLTAIVLIWTYRQLFIVNLATGIFVTAALLGLSFIRARQGYEIIRFQRNLKRLPEYIVSSDQIPWSETEMFLGKGFRWNQKHTQRLHQARSPANEHLRARNKYYDWARDFERQYPQTIISKLLRSKSFWNPVAPLPPVGGDPAIHGIEPHEREMWMDIGERVGHTLVLGTTRVGKTRLAEILITQDIRRGDAVFVFDPKGDDALLRRMYAEAVRCGREEQFYFFHLGYPDKSDRYSPIGTFGRITEVATRIANQLPSEGQSAAFKEFVWRFVNVMARAGAAIGIRPTYEWIYQNAVNIDSLCVKYFEMWLDRDHAGWRDQFARANFDHKQLGETAKKTGRTMDALEKLAFIRQMDWHDPIGDALASVLANDRTYFEKLVSSLYPLLEKLTTGKIAELLSPEYDDLNDPRRIFDWDKAIAQEAIVYVGLDSLSDHEVAAAVGNAMFADLTSTAGRAYKYGYAYGQRQRMGKVRVSIHADEFNELIGDEFVPLLNKAGGAGYQVTVYTQTWSDVEAKIGDRAKAQQIAGNLNTLIMLRVKNIETAEILTDQLPMVELLTTTLVSGANDANDGKQEFSSSAQDRMTSREVPMIQPADLVQLPKGQAFALIEGGQLVKLRMPLASDDGDICMPPDLEAIAQDMHARYQVYVNAVAANDQDMMLEVAA